MADTQNIELIAIDDATIELTIDGDVISTVTLDMETSMLDASAVVDIVNQYVLAMQSKVEADIPTAVSQLVNDLGFVSEDTNTTYTLTRSGNDLVLTGSDGSEYNVTLGNISPSETYYQSGSDGWRFAYAFDNGDVWWSPYYQSGDKVTKIEEHYVGNFTNDGLKISTRTNETFVPSTSNIKLPYSTLARNGNRIAIIRNYPDGTQQYGTVLDLSPIIPTVVTYSVSMSGNTITLTGSDGSTSTIDLPVYDGGTT